MPDASAASPLAIPNPCGGLLGRIIAPLLPLAHRALGLHGMERLMREVDRLGPTRGPGEAWGRVLRIRAETEPGPLANVPQAGPVVFVANHAMGAPDAIAMAAFAEQVRPDTRFIVNRLLALLPRIAERSFLVDPFGGLEATRRSAAGMRQAIEHLNSGGAIAVFPAGEVSHLTWDRRSVSDPAWNPLVAKLIARSKATVVPVYFHGRNRWSFQIAGLMHPRLRTALLARETLAAAGRTVSFSVGSAIPWTRLATHGEPEEVIEYLRARTYLLRDRPIDPARVVNMVERRSLPRGDGSRKAATKPKLRRPSPAGSLAPVPTHPVSPPAKFASEIESLGTEAFLLQHRDWDIVVGRRANLPRVVEEIGRLREIAFREVGEGSGKRLDLDRFDEEYLHLFLWDRRRREILGAYRLGPTDEILPKHGIEGLYTHTLFDFGDALMSQISPALELGRSFVRPEYQRHPAALMLLWKGIGRFLASNPRYRMMFGPVSISNAYQSMSRRLLMSFLSAAPRLSGFGDLIRPRNPVSLEPVTDFNEARLRRVAADLDEVDQLVREIESNQRTVPVLLRQYLKLNAKLLGFNIDPEFHDCLDGLMLVDLLDCDRRIMDQYMGPDGAVAFLAEHRGTLASRTPTNSAGIFKAI
ncbi:MAG: lysophospholipid acyltransferase family protein [Phycisphaerales bacterium]